MEELFDKELQGMVKFTDARPAIKEAAAKQQASATNRDILAGKGLKPIPQQQKPEKKQPAPAAAAEKKDAPQQEKKAQRSEAKYGSWEPVKGEPTYIERLQACVKWCALYGGLCVLLFYWQQTGQMESSAAVPSMIVCALLAGVGVGKHWKWR